MISLSPDIIFKQYNLRRGAGVVELAALEKRYGATHRGFESLPLRQVQEYDLHGRVFELEDAGI